MLFELKLAFRKIFFLKYYENAEDLNRSDFKEKRGRDNIKGDFNSGNTRERSSFNSGRNSGYTRLFINLGTKDGFYKASFLQFILDESDLKKEVLGKIDMRDMNSWIEIESSAAKKMISALDGKNYKGRRIRMNDADSGGPRGFNKNEG